MNTVKRMNFKRKIISCIVIWGVIIGSLLSYSPDTHVLSAGGVPEISIIAPVEDSVFDAPSVELTGTITDDDTPPESLLVKVFDQQSATQQPREITNEGTLTIKPNAPSADFTYVKTDFSVGNHTVSIIITDKDGISSSPIERTFTVNQSGSEETTGTEIGAENQAADTGQTSTTTESSTGQLSNVTSVLAEDTIGKRPYLAKMYLIPKDASEEYIPDGDVPSTYLPVEDMTRVPLDYKILIDIRSTDPLIDIKTQPLLTSFGDITGVERLVKTTALSNDLKSYVYSFTPVKNFFPRTTYNVYLNPKFTTVSQIPIIPRFLKFTTAGKYEEYQFPADNGDNLNNYRDNDYVHGPFSVVTNACSYCHSTHNGTNEFLINGKNGTNENDMCMSCHDGTGSPKIEDNSQQSKHFESTSVSCSSCHDPHNPGTKENPNSIHRMASGNGSLYSYKKAGTAAGVSMDFSLCFTCHNGSKAKNIEKYYTDGTFKSQSGHNIQATIDSGSSLNGQLPCADCHETHGATNLNMLRSELGNEKLQGEKPKTDQLDDNWFSKTDGDWDIDSQRKFCLSCHNGQTVLYGETGKAIYNKETGISLTSTVEHNRNSTKACSECHSDSKSFIDTAHAPKRIIP